MKTSEKLRQNGVVCKTCRHYKHDHLFHGKFSKCKAIRRINDYGGMFIPHLQDEYYQYCSIERNNYGNMKNCGSRGILYVPKVSWYQRIVSYWKQTS